MTTPPHKLCMIPGPIEFHEAVLQAMATPATSHLDPHFMQQFQQCFPQLRQLLAAMPAAQPFIVAGSGTLGWDMAVVNLMQTGDRALICNTGYFGDHFGECFEEYGYRVDHVRAPTPGDVPSLDAVASHLSVALKSGTAYKMVVVTHVDTSTGVRMDVEAVSRLVREHSPGTLLAVDGVCSVGAEELYMEQWGVDVVMTSSQKAIGVPPGLCIVVCSPRAMQVFAERTEPVRHYFGNWKHWLPIMKAYEDGRPSYFATPPVQLIMALHTSLTQILALPIRERFQRHREASERFKKQLESWSIQQVPARPEIAAHSMTAIRYPKGLTASQVLPALSEQGIIVAGGLLPGIAPTYFRIGHMGLSVMELERRHLDRTLDALRLVFTKLGA